MAWFKCMGGSYTDYSNKTVTASAVTSDSNYTYLTIPNEGIYNTGSKVRTLNSNLANLEYMASGTYYSTQYGANVQSRTDFKNNGCKTLQCSQSGGGIFTIQGSPTKDFSSGVTNIGNTNDTSTTITRDITNYPYVRVVLTRTSTGTTYLTEIKGNK